MSYKNLNPIIKKFIVSVFLYGITSSAFDGFFGIYIKELGHPESFVGTILSLRGFAVALSTLVIAFISRKIGYKRTLLMGHFTVCISSILIVLTEEMYLMKIIAVLYGFGQAAMFTVESPFLYSQSKVEERVHAFSLTFAVKNAAFMMGSLFTGFLADIFSKILGGGAASIRSSLIFVSAIGLIGMIPLAALKPKPIKKQEKLDIGELKGFFTKRNSLFLAHKGFSGFGAGLVVPFFGVYLKYMLNITESLVGLILSLAQLGNVFGGLSIPFLSRRMGNHKVVVVTQLLSIPFLISIGFPQGIILVAISFFFRSFFMNMGQPVVANISMDIVDESQRPLMSAMRSMVRNLMRSIGIFAGGKIMTNFTYNTPYIFTVLSYLIGIIIFYNLFKNEIKNYGNKEQTN